MHRIARLVSSAFERPAGTAPKSTLALGAPAAPPRPSGGLFALAKKHPLAAAVLCGSLKDSTCDVMTQKATSDSWDWRRTAVFATFGATFVGAWQYWLFSVAVPRLVPSSASFAAAPLRRKLRDGAGLAGIAAFVAVENLFNQPFAHFPVLYTIKYALTHSGASPAEALEKGVAETRETFWQDNANSCAVWVPATLINGLFVPVALRVPFMTLTGCGWTTFMSYTKGAPAADADHHADPVKEAYAARAGRQIPRAPRVAEAVDGLFASPWARLPFMNLVGCGLSAFAARALAAEPVEPERPRVPLTPEVLKAVEALSAASAAAEDEGDTIAVASHREVESRPSLLSLFDAEEDEGLKKAA